MNSRKRTKMYLERIDGIMAQVYNLDYDVLPTTSSATQYGLIELGVQSLLENSIYSERFTLRENKQTPLLTGWATKLFSYSTTWLTTLHTFHETPNVLIENKEDCTFYSGEMTRPLENSAREMEWQRYLLLSTIFKDFFLPTNALVAYNELFNTLKLTNELATSFSGPPIAPYKMDTFKKDLSAEQRSFFDLIYSTFFSVLPYSHYIHGSFYQNTLPVSVLNDFLGEYTEIHLKRLKTRYFHDFVPLNFVEELSLQIRNVLAPIHKIQELTTRKSIDISSTQIRVEKWLENFHIETCVTTTLLPFLMMLSYSTELESLKVEDIYLTDTGNTCSFLSEFSEGTIHIEPFVYYAKQKSFVLHFSKDHFNITLNDVRIYIEKHQLQKYVLHQHCSLFTHLRWVVWQSKVKRKTKNNN